MPKKNNLKVSLAYRRCEKLTKICIELGYQTITRADLVYLIKRHVGSDKRTISKYLHDLTDFGFIRLHKGGNYIILRYMITQKTLKDFEVAKSIATTRNTVKNAKDLHPMNYRIEP